MNIISIFALLGNLLCVAVCLQLNFNCKKFYSIQMTVSSILGI